MWHYATYGEIFSHKDQLRTIFQNIAVVLKGLWNLLLKLGGLLLVLIFNFYFINAKNCLPNQFSSSKLMFQVSIHQLSSPQAGYNVRSIFKQYLNLELVFFYTYTGSVTQAKEPSPIYYLSIDKRWTDRFLLFQRALVQNLNPFRGFHFQR